MIPGVISGNFCSMVNFHLEFSETSINCNEQTIYIQVFTISFDSFLWLCLYNSLLFYYHIIPSFGINYSTWFQKLMVHDTDPTHSILHFEFLKGNVLLQKLNSYINSRQYLKLQIHMLRSNTETVQWQKFLNTTRRDVSWP